MIKTVKVEKKLRLDELIKYVWDNNATEKRVFLGNREQRVVFDNVGGFYPSGYAYSPDTTFTVEVEEEINNKTIFKSVVGVLNDDRIMLTNTYTTIEDFQDNHGSMKEIHAVIDGKLQLIWEDE